MACGGGSSGSGGGSPSPAERPWCCTTRQRDRCSPPSRLQREERVGERGVRGCADGPRRVAIVPLPSRSGLPNGSLVGERPRGEPGVFGEGVAERRRRRRGVAAPLARHQTFQHAEGAVKIGEGGGEMWRALAGAAASAAAAWAAAAAALAVGPPAGQIRLSRHLGCPGTHRRSPAGPAPHRPPPLRRRRRPPRPPRLPPWLYSLCASCR